MTSFFTLLRCDSKKILYSNTKIGVVAIIVPTVDLEGTKMENNQKEMNHH